MSAKWGVIFGSIVVPENCRGRGQNVAMGEEVLFGGVANAGLVTRDGRYVLRPSNDHSRSIHRFLISLRDLGFAGASVPVGIEVDKRERLLFIEGDVPLPAYPPWAQGDDALASVADLMRGFHAASRLFDPAGSTWSDEMADHVGGPVVCHNDVCLENVVFRDGTAVGLLDFDFAAPGRPVYDLAQFARMCVPIDDEVNAGRLGWLPANSPARLRLIADTYGLDVAGRHELLAILADAMEHGGAFLRRRIEAGDPNFIKMWDDMGGAQRFDRRRLWWTEHHDRFAGVLR